MSTQVEFRLFQLVTNIVGDERVTLALIHWDGKELRTAWRKRPVPGYGDVEQFFPHMPPRSEDVYAKGLAEIVPVRGGEGGVVVHCGYFYWSAVRIGFTLNTKAHFDELVGLLRL